MLLKLLNERRSWANQKAAPLEKTPENGSIRRKMRLALASIVKFRLKPGKVLGLALKADHFLRGVPVTTATRVHVPKRNWQRTLGYRAAQDSSGSSVSRKTRSRQRFAPTPLRFSHCFCPRPAQRHQFLLWRRRRHEGGSGSNAVTMGSGKGSPLH